MDARFHGKGRRIGREFWENRQEGEESSPRPISELDTAKRVRTGRGRKKKGKRSKAGQKRRKGSRDRIRRGGGRGDLASACLPVRVAYSKSRLQRRVACFSFLSFLFPTESIFVESSACVTPFPYPLLDDTLILLHYRLIGFRVLRSCIFFFCFFFFKEFSDKVFFKIKASHTAMKNVWERLRTLDNRCRNRVFLNRLAIKHREMLEEYSLLLWGKECLKENVRFVNKKT